jgi:hypothetical protein
MITDVKYYLDGGSVGIIGGFYYENGEGDIFEYGGEIFIDGSFKSVSKGTVLIDEDKNDEWEEVEREWVKQKLLDDLKTFDLDAYEKVRDLM